MDYSVNKITSLANCDSLIEVVNKEKDNLQYRKTTQIAEVEAFIAAGKPIKLVTA